MTDSNEIAAVAGKAMLPSPISTGGEVLRSGADVVYAAEDLYFRLFRMMLVLLAAASAWSVWARLADAQRGSLILTAVYAGCGFGLSAVGLALGWRAYAWLRYSRIRQLTPAIVAVIMLLTDGPHSPTWWMAFALLFVMASISSTSLTLLGAVLAAGAYIGGTLLRGSPLVYRGDTGNLIGAAMLIINALAARSIGEAFGSFVMRLHRLEAEIRDTERVPKKVRNMMSEPRDAVAATSASNAHKSPRGGWRAVLTARQLEVAFLVRDGLYQDEIAACLSISRRQVERLLQQARERSGAATTSELVAMLVRSQFVPPPRDGIWCEEPIDLSGPDDLASSSA